MYFKNIEDFTYTDQDSDKRIKIFFFSKDEPENNEQEINEKKNAIA